MNIDWDAPFTILSPAGTTFLNQDLGGGRMLRVNAKRSVGRRGIRATKDSIPQNDGDIFHERYAEGSELQLAIQFWDGEECACDEVLVDMYDDLRGILWSLLRPTSGGGDRVIWTPAGKDQRMIHGSRLLQLNDPDEDQEFGCIEMVVIIDTPFPYAIALTQDLTSIANTVTATVPNDGNVEFWPIIKVFSVGTPCTAFTLESDIPDLLTGLNLLIEWDSSFGGTAIGAGQFAEIDTFKGTMFLNGDEDDLSPSLVATTSDFFPIKAGGTDVNAIGAGGFDRAEFLTNDAFA